MERKPLRMRESAGEERMAFVNFSTREITAKIVYYGPGLCGKTTSLQYIFDSIVPENKGEMVSLATDVDRTIYFDFLPVTLGKIQNFTARIQLYTVPGQVRYNSTRKLVLSGTDGVVFVADSQRDLLDENLKSYENLKDNLEEQGRSLPSLPHIMQYNKRDLPKLSSVGELNRELNKQGVPHFETCATSGMGILEGLKSISKLVMQDLNKRGVVDKKRVRTFVPRSQTDSIARPMVGAAVAAPVEAEVAEEQPSEDPFDAPSPFYDRPFGDFREDDELLESARADPYGLDDSGPGLSFAALFDDSEQASRVRALESEMPYGEHKELVQHAGEVFERVLDDPNVFPDDMPTSARVAMLGVSLRRYAHFQRLLAASTLDRVDCFFILHFLTDLQLGKTIG